MKSNTSFTSSMEFTYTTLKFQIKYEIVFQFHIRDEFFLKVQFWQQRRTVAGRVSFSFSSGTESPAMMARYSCTHALHGREKGPKGKRFEQLPLEEIQAEHQMWKMRRTRPQRPHVPPYLI